MRRSRLNPRFMVAERAAAASERVLLVSDAYAVEGDLLMVVRTGEIMRVVSVGSPLPLAVRVERGSFPRPQSWWRLLFRLPRRFEGLPGTRACSIAEGDELLIVGNVVDCP